MPAVASANATVAVCYSGWLAVRVPQHGFLARQHLVDVLHADVFVAGTFWPSDCGAGGFDSCSERLFNRLRGLRPFARTQLDPMLTIDALHSLVSRSPNWPQVKASFRPQSTFLGISVWAPLLGNGNLSVLRELHDYSRVIRLVALHERARRLAYERIVFSRLEFMWLAAHPPLDVLSSKVVWLPSGGVAGGLNDRHALMDRGAAEVYFRRWELLFSPRLLKSMPHGVVLHGGPEEFLQYALEIEELRIRYFPATMVLGCCGRNRRCFGRQVYAHRRMHPPSRLLPHNCLANVTGASLTVWCSVTVCAKCRRSIRMSSSLQGGTQLRWPAPAPVSSPRHEGPQQILGARRDRAMRLSS
jgi:hypothetical protein